MNLFLTVVLFFSLGLLQAQSLQVDADITLVPVNSSSRNDSIEVELSFQMKDMTVDQVEILLGSQEGSGEYGFIVLVVKERNGKKVLEESGHEIALTNGKIIITRRLPKEVLSGEVYVQVNGKDNTRNNKCQAYRKVKLKQ